MGLTVGVDVGGTKVAAGVVDESGKILARARTDTPSTSPSATQYMIVEAVEQLRRDHDVEAVGVGAAGFIDERRSTVLFAPNLAWRNEPLQAHLQEQLQLPVVIENDANAAAWGEARYGAGRGHDNVAVITAGTGIGGG